VSAVVAVCRGSTWGVVLGPLVFWMLCWAVNMTHHHLIAHEVKGVTPMSAFLIDVAYWVLPKPLDLSGIFYDVMNAKTHSAPVPELEAVKAKGQFAPELAVLTSLLFAVGILALAVHEFRTTDY